MSNLIRFKAWFDASAVQTPVLTTRQRLLGFIGIILGALSATVNLPLGYAFGHYLSSQLGFTLQWASFISWYFGITAMIPLLFLAARTAYIVLRDIAAPANAHAQQLFTPLPYRSFKSLILWLLAMLSAIPFLYITHTHLVAQLRQWVYLIDVAAYIAPVLVNRWALHAAGNILANTLRDFMDRQQRQERTQLRFQLRRIIQNLQRLNTSHIVALYHQIHLPRYQEIDALTTFISIDTTRNFQLSYTQRFVGLIGACIGAGSTYQYYGNGLAAAAWLHFPLLFTHLIAISALVCNAALGAYTGKIVFEEFYRWIVQGLKKLTHRSPLPPVATHISTHILQIFGIFVILLVAISAATPNVYLTVQLQKNPLAFLNILISICAFIGPFVTNFFAISNAFIQTSERQKLISGIENIIDIIPQLRSIYVQALLTAFTQESQNRAQTDASDKNYDDSNPHKRLISG
jgi:hypothetical protein